MKLIESNKKKKVPLKRIQHHFREITDYTCVKRIKNYWRDGGSKLEKFRKIDNKVF
jgi:hypothetical protein